MNRLLFFNVATTEGINEIDHSLSNVDNFVYNYSPSYHRVTEIDLLRPDLISYVNYATVDYWWLIMVLNDIFDPFNDLAVGALLKMPNILDIYEYYKKNKVRS